MPGQLRTACSFQVLRYVTYQVRNVFGLCHSPGSASIALRQVVSGGVMLRFDLFEFLERSLRGFVDSLRNILLTVALLARYPVRGPRVAERRFRDQSRRQIGGLTLLFIAFFLVLSLAASGRLGPLEWSERARQVVATGFTFQWSSLWPPLIGALTSTVLLDVLIRIWLRTNSPLGLVQRKVATETVEYALFLPSLSLALWYLLVLEIPPGWAGAAVLLVASVLLYLSVAAATRVLRTTVEGALPIKQSWSPVGAPFGTLVVLVLSLAAGVSVARALQIRTDAIVLDSQSTMQFIGDVRCPRTGGDLEIELMLTNWSDRPIFVDLANTTTVLLATSVSQEGSREVIKGYHTILSDIDALTLVEPGRSALVRAKIDTKEIEQEIKAGRSRGRLDSLHGIHLSGCYLLPYYYLGSGEVTVTRPWRAKQSGAIGGNHIFRYSNGAVGTIQED